MTYLQNIEFGKYYKRIDDLGITHYFYCKKCKYNEVPEGFKLDISPGKMIFWISYSFFTDIYNEYKEITKEEFDNVFQQYTLKLLELNK